MSRQRASVQVGACKPSQTCEQKRTSVLAGYIGASWRGIGGQCIQKENVVAPVLRVSLDSPQRRQPLPQLSKQRCSVTIDSHIAIPSREASLQCLGAWRRQQARRQRCNDGDDVLGPQAERVVLDRLHAGHVMHDAGLNHLRDARRTVPVRLRVPVISDEHAAVVHGRDPVIGSGDEALGRVVGCRHGRERDARAPVEARVALAGHRPCAVKA